MMRYLKLYEWYKSAVVDRSPKQVEELFSPYINWEMIQDVKDLSLEYLDKGITLELYISVDEVVIYEMYFNHDINKSNYKWNRTQQDDVDAIEYYFDFLPVKRMDNTFSVEMRREVNEDLFEFVDILKSMYPDEKIKKG